MKFIMMNKKVCINKSSLEDVKGFYIVIQNIRCRIILPFTGHCKKKFVLIADIEFLDKHLKAKKGKNGLKFEYITYKICEYASQNVYL